MTGSRKFAVGAKLVGRHDDGLTAEVVEMKLFHGIEHYRVKVRPAHVHATSIWLSGFGLDREFASPHGSGASPDGVLLRAVTRLMRGDAAQPTPIRRAA
jgi:hypothetical protein